MWWFGIALVGVALVIGIVAGRSRRQPFAAGPGTVVPMSFGFFLAACAVFATVRGTIFNNIWWVIVVTSLATAFGLAVAVLADRAKGENAAKSLIFLPMAISFIGAGIIWRFMYQARDPSTSRRPACSTRSGCGSANEQLDGWQKCDRGSPCSVADRRRASLALAWQGVDCRQRHDGRVRRSASWSSTSTCSTGSSARASAASYDRETARSSPETSRCSSRRRRSTTCG